MIDQKRLLNTFFELVKIDSPSGHEAYVVEYVCKYLTNLGLSPYTDNYGNIICKIDGVGDPIILTAHLDTVAPGRGIDPKVVEGIVRSSGNTILGADNKVGVAAILETIKTIKEKNLTYRNIEIVFTLSEEIGNFGAVNLSYKDLKAKYGYSFDGAGPVGGLVVASPYYNRFDIEIEGVATHAGIPEKGINVVSILNRALDKIKLGRIDEDTLCNIGRIECGSVRNTVPGNLQILGEVRSFVEKKVDKQTQYIKNTFEDCTQDFGGNMRCNIQRENGGFKLDKDDPQILDATKILSEMNIPCTFIEATGCYDANVFFENGIKIINFNNGSAKNHTVDEYITVIDLVNTAEIACRLATNM